METKEIIENIDWSELRNQKRILLELDTKTDEQKDGIEGILSLIDQLQDYACDVMNIPSINIYDFEMEDNEDDDTNPDRMSPNIVNNFGVETITVIENTLKYIEWTLEEKNMITSIINKFGTSQHPVCDDKTFDYFNIEYLNEILIDNKVKILNALSPMGLKLVTAIKIKLGIM